ncbi:hypothetical protein ACJMK2_014835 [Sinanodonta woodiana]|uniref:Mono(ADP-ribosyl)transferase n=1 Tax=Sinanodonta woodiana TaxID=1069815 RepID=A0ABD3V4Z9_SINWO
MTAIELAGAYGFTDVKKVLTNHICNFETEAEEIDTFYPWHADMELKGPGLIDITLTAYKNTFHPKNIDPRKPIVTVLGDIFNDLNTSQNRWKDVRDKICDSLYVVSDVSGKQLKKCASRQEFYESIVNVYTNESTFLYTIMNTALRRQNVSDYKPSAMDLAMGPYVVMFQTLLLFWAELTRETATTYRRMLLTEKDVEQYQTGVRFTWLSFVSSSVDLEKALPFPTRSEVKDGCIVIFTIDNTIRSTHTPRNIEKYAQYMERERVYPTGSTFVVTGRRRERNNDIYVDLKLLSS